MDVVCLLSSDLHRGLGFCLVDLDACLVSHTLRRSVGVLCPHLLYVLLRVGGTEPWELPRLGIGILDSILPVAGFRGSSGTSVGDFIFLCSHSKTLPVILTVDTTSST